MRIASVGPSFTFTGKSEQQVVLPDKEVEYKFDDLKWNEGEISVKEAISRLEKKMYPFKEVIDRTPFNKINLILYVCISFLLLDSLSQLFGCFQDGPAREQAGALHNALGCTGRPVLLRFGTDTPGWPPGVFVRHVSTQGQIRIYVGIG